MARIYGWEQMQGDGDEIGLQQSSTPGVSRENEQLDSIAA